MNDRILNVYESENTNPLVYSCHFGPGELKEAVKEAIAAFAATFAVEG